MPIIVSYLVYISIIFCWGLFVFHRTGAKQLLLIMGLSCWMCVQQAAEEDAIHNEIRCRCHGPST